MLVKIVIKKIQTKNKKNQTKQKKKIIEAHFKVFKEKKLQIKS